MAAQDPRPSAHDPVPGCSLDRRAFLKTSVAAGAIAAGGATSSGTATANEYKYCLSETEGRKCGTQQIADGISKAAGWLLGDSSDDDEPVEEYDENEWLRIHGDSYLDAIETYASNRTTTTWLEDNAQYSEGAAYSSALKVALREIKENAASRSEAMYAGEQAVIDHYTVAQQEMIEEFHLNLRKYKRQLELLDVLTSEIDNSLTDVLHIAESPSNDRHMGQSGGDFTNFDPSVPQVTYDLLNGETVDVPTFLLEWDVGQSGTGWTPDYYDGVLALRNFSAQSPDSGNLVRYRASDEAGEYHPATEITLFVNSFDRATYNNIYSASVPDSAIDGKQVFIDFNMWNDAATNLLNTKDTAVSNVRTFIDNVYADVVDGDLTYDDIVTHEMLVQDASDDDPLARANAHLGLMGHSAGDTHTTIRFPDLLEDPDGSDGNETNSTNETIGGEYSYADLGTNELKGTIFLRPQPSDPLKVGNTYTVSNLGGDTTTEVMFTFATEDADGNRTANMIELEQSDQFEITEAKRLNEDGDLVSVDQIEFSGSAPTETPTDYDEMHQKLDQMEKFNKEVLAQQRKLIEELAEEEDDGPGPIFPDFDLSGGGGLLGLGIIGVVILAVFGIVTDAIPGLGND